MRMDAPQAGDRGTEHDRPPGRLTGIVGVFWQSRMAVAHERAAILAREVAEDQTNKTNKANDDLRRTNRKANQSLSDYHFEHGIKLLESHEPEGLLWLTRALAMAPTDDEARQVAIRRNLFAAGQQCSNLGVYLPCHETVFDFSPDGKTVLTASNDQQAQLWRVESGQPIGRPITHGATILTASFNPDGTLILTAGEDKKVRLSSATDGTQVGTTIVCEDKLDLHSSSPTAKPS